MVGWGESGYGGVSKLVEISWEDDVGMLEMRFIEKRARDLASFNRTRVGRGAGPGAQGAKKKRPRGERGAWRQK